MELKFPEKIYSYFWNLSKILHTSPTQKKNVIRPFIRFEINLNKRRPQRSYYQAEEEVKGRT